MDSVRQKIRSIFHISSEFNGINVLRGLDLILLVHGLIFFAKLNSAATNDYRSPASGLRAEGGAVLVKSMGFAWNQ